MAELTYRLRMNPHLITVCLAHTDWETQFGTHSMTLDVEVDTTPHADGQHFIARMRFPTPSDAMLFKLAFTAPADSPIYERAP